jgi:hypothetical protein
VLEMGQVHAVRTAPQTTTDLADEPVASGGGSSLWIGVFIAFMVGLSVAGMMFYRKEQAEVETPKAFSNFPSEGDEGEFVWSGSTVTEELHAEDDSPPAVATVDHASEVASHAAPSRDTPPTSVDSSGYEWYSTPDGHWYRVAGSQADWSPYQP